MAKSRTPERGVEIGKELGAIFVKGAKNGPGITQADEDRINKLVIELKDFPPETQIPDGGSIRFPAQMSAFTYLNRTLMGHVNDIQDSAIKARIKAALRPITYQLNQASPLPHLKEEKKPLVSMQMETESKNPPKKSQKSLLQTMSDWLGKATQSTPKTRDVWVWLSSTDLQRMKNRMGGFKNADSDAIKKAITPSDFFHGFSGEYFYEDRDSCIKSMSKKINEREQNLKQGTSKNDVFDKEYLDSPGALVYVTTLVENLDDSHQTFQNYRIDPKTVHIREIELYDQRSDIAKDNIAKTIEFSEPVSISSKPWQGK